MATNNNYGHKRLVVGAHYGAIDFIVQRITAIIMAAYTVILVIGLLALPFSFESWRLLFTFRIYTLPVGQLLATLAFLALAWHAWIGVRDIWIDYVKPVGVRLLLHLFTVLWLVGSVVYFAQSLWRI